MPEEKSPPSRARRRAAKRRAKRRKTAVVLTGSALVAGTLGWPAAYLADGRFPAAHLPTHVVTLGTVGLACYTMVFLLGEATLLALAVINIRDEKVHNRYKSLMLLVLYVFTLRYRRVLPAKFFADSIIEPKSEDKPREPGKHGRWSPGIGASLRPLTPRSGAGRRRTGA